MYLSRLAVIWVALSVLSTRWFLVRGRCVAGKGDDVSQSGLSHHTPCAIRTISFCDSALRSRQMELLVHRWCFHLRDACAYHRVSLAVDATHECVDLR